MAQRKRRLNSANDEYQAHVPESHKTRCRAYRCRSVQIHHDGFCEHCWGKEQLSRQWRDHRRQGAYNNTRRRMRPA